MKSLLCRAVRSPIRGEHSVFLQPRLGACLALGLALCAPSMASAAPPAASPDTYTTTFDRGLVVPAGEGLLVNDSDPDGDAIFVIPPGSMFGVGGTDPGQFLLPQGIALDDAGNIYATNAFTPRAEKFDANGNHLSSFDIQGGIGIAIEDNGNVLISKGNLIYRFAPDGPLLETFGDQHLSDAWGMTLDADGNIFVVENGPKLVSKLSPTGELLLRFGALGGAPGQFGALGDVTLDADGNIYIAEYNGHRIQKFDPSGGNPVIIGGPGTGPGEFNTVSGIALDSKGNMVVTDNVNHRIQVLDPEGNFLAIFGNRGSARGQFLFPWGVVIDPQDNILIADKNNNRIQRIDHTWRPQRGEFGITPDGAFTYTPEPGFVGTQTFQYAVSDGIDESQTVTVTLDIRSPAPVLTNPGGQTSVDGQDVQLALQATDPNGAPLAWSAVGLPPGLAIDAGNGVISGTLADDASLTGPYVVQVQATNGRFSDEILFVWMVGSSNRAPSIARPDTQTSTEGDQIDLGLVASDLDGDTLVFAATGLPDGLDINPQTGRISGTVAVGATQSSPHLVRVQVSDSQASADAEFIWVVSEVPVVNLAPVLTNPGAQSSTEGESIALSIVATDPENAPLSFSARGLPGGLVISAVTGAISGTVLPGAAQQSPFLVQVDVSDGVNAASEVFLWQIDAVQRPNRAPVVVNPGTQRLEEGQGANLTLQATDPDNDALIFGVTGLPNGLVFDAQTRTIVGAVALGAAQQSPFLVQIEVSDGQLSAQTGFLWVIGQTQIVNQAPTLRTPGTQASTEGDLVGLTLQAADPENAPLTFAAEGLPGGLGIDPGTGRIAGTIAPGASQNSPHLVQVSVSDGDLSASVAFLWVVGAVEVFNFPPEVSTPDPQSAQEGDAVSLDLIATDPNGDQLSYAALGLPDGLSIDGATGVISGTVAEGAAQQSPFLVQIEVSDGVNTVDAAFLWQIDAVVRPNRAPVVVNPGTQRLEEGQGANLTLQATDPDNDALSLVVTGLPSGLVFDPQTRSITGTVAQGAALQSPFLVQIEVSDGQLSAQTGFLWLVGQVQVVNQAPTIRSPGTQRSEEGDTVALAFEAADPEGDALAITVTGLPGGLDFDAQTRVIGGTIAVGAALQSPFLVQIEASDGQLSAQTSFLWSVDQTLAVDLPPVLADPGSQSSVEGDAVVLALEANDPEGGALVFSALGLPDGLGLDEVTGAISGTVAEGAAQQSPFLVQIEVSDGANTVEASFIWLVQPPVDLPPVVENPGNQSNLEGDTAMLQVVGSDPEGGALSWFAIGLPAGLSIDAEGLISGQIEASASASSPHLVEVAADDGVSTSTATFLWNVTREAVAPSLQVTLGGPFVVGEGQSIVIEGGASSEGVTFSWDLDGDGQCNDAMGPSAPFEALDGPATLPIKLCADDGALSASADSLVLVTNEAPFILSVPAALLVHGETYAYEVLADDPGDDALTVALLRSPEGAELDGNTLRWTPTAEQLAETSTALSIEVCDEDGDCDAQTWTLRIEAPDVPATTTPDSGGCATAPGPLQGRGATLWLVLALGLLWRRARSV